MNNVTVSFFASIFLATACSSGGGDGSAENAPEFDLAGAITTGSDESSTGFWECTFINQETNESGLNTITFWENGRGITGGGSLYSWSLISTDMIEGIFDSQTRTFLFEQFEFSEDLNSFVALDSSTRELGTVDEFTILLDSSCQRNG